MPQLGETVTEGTVAQWLKKPGDSVEKYEAFVEISTDKVTAEVPSPVSGVLREIIVKEGDTVPTGTPIAIIDDVGGEHAHAQRPSGGACVAEANRQASDEPSRAFARRVAATERRAAQRQGGVASRRRCAGSRASTKSISRRCAVPATTDALPQTTCSPPQVRVRRPQRRGGRATAALITDRRRGRRPRRRHRPAGPPRCPGRPGRFADGALNRPSRRTIAARPGDVIPLSQARKIIAQRMVESKHTAPHAWTMVEVDVTNVWKWRTAEKDPFEKSTAPRSRCCPSSSAPWSSRSRRSR